MAKRTKTQKSVLRLEALEQRQLLAGVTGAGDEVLTDITHPNGNVYDQILLTGGSVTVTADAGQITRVSWLDASGDILQGEFSGSGTLTVSMADGYTTGVAPTGYNQSVSYVQGLASFTITGSTASTNFSVFSVGQGTPHVNSALFDDTHTGGDHWADVQRLTIVADTNNPNGSVFGGIRAGNAIFSGESGVVGITAADVQVQDVVRIGDLDAKGTATPALTFGTSSQFGSIEVAGGDLAQTNGKSINNSASYGYQIQPIANVDSAGTAIPAGTISPQTTFTDPIEGPDTTINFTAAIDNLVGTSGDDSFVASHTDSTAVVSALDKVSGGAGNDALIISDSDGGTAQLDGLTVTDVESFIYTSTGNMGGGTLDISGWTGLTSATITLQNVAAADQSLTAAGTTAVSVNSKSTSATPGNWTITGGSTVKLTNSATLDLVAVTSDVAIVGVEGTTSVEVIQTAGDEINNAVNVTDWATGDDDQETGTIASVTLNGVGAASTITSNALTSLSLTDAKESDGDNIVITLDDDLDAHGDGDGTTLAVSLNDSNVTLDDANSTIKQLNITASGAASTALIANGDEITTITVTGDKKVTLGDLGGLDELATLTATGSGGITAEVTEDVAVTTGDGADTITLEAAAKADVSLGAGNDKVTAPLEDGETLDGGSLDGGDGTDTLALDGDDAVDATAGTALAGSISGFEKLEISSAGTGGGTINLANLDSINQVVLAATMGGAYTLDNMASGASLTITATQGGDGTIDVPVSAIQTETLSVSLSSGAGVDAKALHTGDIAAVNLSLNDTGDGADTMDAIEFDEVNTITVTGETGTLTLISGDAENVDLSGLSDGNVVLTTTAGDDGVIKGSTKGTNNITATGAGDDITIITGNENDTIAVGSGGSTITAGNGTSSITVAGGSNTITLGSGADTVDLNGMSGTNTVSLGDGNDSITVEGLAVSNITLGGGTDTVVLASEAGVTGYFTSITGAGDNDVIDLSATGNGAAATEGGQVTLGQGASFTDYIAEAAVGNGAANSIISWFQFGGDTYIVQDNTMGDYDPATDVVIRLTGTINLGSGSTNMDVAGTDSVITI